MFNVQTLPIGESNRRSSVQTPSDRSIDHPLVGWQSGILQSQGARFCMLPFRPENLVMDLASRPSLTTA